MPTYFAFRAVPAGQTRPLVGRASAYSGPRKVPFCGSSPRRQRQNLTYETICQLVFLKTETEKIKKVRLKRRTSRNGSKTRSIIYARNRQNIWLPRCRGNALCCYPANATGIKRDDIQPVLVGINDMTFSSPGSDYYPVILNAVPGYTCSTPIRHNTYFYSAKTVRRLLFQQISVQTYPGKLF